MNINQTFFICRFRSGVRIPNISVSVLGSQCAANADCSDTVTNSVCDTGDTSTCICSDGYNANDANTACDLGKYIENKFANFNVHYKQIGATKTYFGILKSHLPIRYDIYAGFIVFTG